MAELVDVDTESLGGIPRGLCPGEIYFHVASSIENLPVKPCYFSMKIIYKCIGKIDSSIEMFADKSDNISMGCLVSV